MSGETEDSQDDEDDDFEDLAEDEDVSLEDLVGEGDDDFDPDALLDPKERATRALEIRRAIEERAEQRRLQADLNYLDEEFDE